MIAFSCPHCARPLEVPPERGGLVLLCRHCGLACTAPLAEVDSTNAPIPKNARVDSSVLLISPDVHAALRSAATPEDADALAGPISSSALVTPAGSLSAVYAAELASQLSNRMRPVEVGPPRLESVAALLVAGGAVLVGVGLWVAGFVLHPTLFPFVALTGALLLALGVAAAVVPRRHSARLPALYIACGTAVLLMGLAGPTIRRDTGAWLTPATAGSAGAIPRSAGPLARIIESKEYRRADILIDTLANLAEFPTTESLSPTESQELAREAERLCREDTRVEVRAAALPVLVRWGPSSVARTRLLEMLRSSEGVERSAALAIAFRFPDAEVLAAVVARFEEREDRDDVREALLRFGAAAEPVVLPYLKSDQPFTVFAACDVLEKHGGVAAREALRSMAREHPNPLLRSAGQRSLQVVEARLGMVP
jgi:hypothetical protein